MTGSSVRTEENGPVCTIILDRPERRNAVDRQTAEALRSAFEDFESRDELKVAVSWGVMGTQSKVMTERMGAACPSRGA